MFEQAVQEESEKDNDLLIAFYQTVQEEKEEKKEEEGQFQSAPEAHLLCHMCYIPTID